MAFQGIILLNSMQENPNADLDDLIKQSKKIYTEWKEYDLIHSLKILSKAENEPLLKSIVDFEAVYDELFALNFSRKPALDMLCNARPRLREWISNPPSHLISHAYQHKSSKLLKSCLSAGIPPDLKKFSKCNDNKISDIHYDYFLKKGIKANQADASGITPLHALCCNANAAKLLELLKSWKKEGEELKEPQLFQNALNGKSSSGSNFLDVLMTNAKDLASLKELIDWSIKSGAGIFDETIQKTLVKFKKTEDLEVIKMLLKNAGYSLDDCAFLFDNLLNGEPYEFTEAVFMDLSADRQKSQQNSPEGPAH